MSREILVELLENVPAGPIANNLCGQVIALLQGCWNEFTGSHQTNMQAYKLEPKRVENLDWAPPVLSFKMARHGATALGSRREHLYWWHINVEKMTARFEKGSFRLVRPSAEKLSKDKILEIARRVCEHVRNGPLSLAPPGIFLKWKSETEILIKPADLIPADGFKQTLAGRRKRVRSILIDEMKTIGWVVVSDKGAFVRFRKADVGSGEPQCKTL
jgi:hypothetical protein